MGDLKVTRLSSKEDKSSYIHQLVKDIEALDQMIKDDLIEKSPIRIGAEQEFCLINNEYKASHNSLEVLKEINDKHFTTEIGNYNLEINLDPLELKGDCFSVIEKQLTEYLNNAKAAAAKKQTKILLTGILPTLTLKEIGDENMTPIQRYGVLNKAIKESRRQDFDIHIKGVDEINMLHDSVMLEGCNTSFQIHLQIHPDDFIESYNWAQAISGPILSVCTNSPLLFGKELWSETRIALFTQSVDTRANSFLLNQKQSRVSYGGQWSKGTITDIFKDNIARFRSLVTSKYIKDSVEMLDKGEIPKLSALCLHNGTVYRWNRACYGVGNGKPHLRIENRYIPSGPTVVDEIANMMFWIGVMVGKPERYKNIHKKMDFRDAKANFFNAARYGMATQFVWDGKYICSQNMILDILLPIAREGLIKFGISKKDINYYLNIIEKRVISFTGSQWSVQSFRNLLSIHKEFEAAQTLTANMYKMQEKGSPVSTWNPLNADTLSPFESKKLVKHKMSTDIFSVRKKDSIELVLNIMRWKKINHMPVINNKINIIGLISWNDVKEILDDKEKLKESVSSIMKTDLIITSQFESLETAKERMETNNINCLPVVKKKRLIGILTSKDF
ncbi:MAG: CBS domain-containing protein [Flavobacteriaceae bacterium]|nr:CBS domain-containing protein [Flavobacteriaceae bacterium]